MDGSTEIQIAVAKINKYASSESGDTVEIVERPHGGLSVVIADGQSSGKNAKAISNLVVNKAISLLAEGVRDGAVARAAHDYLLTWRGGKVSAELIIVSVDMVSRSLVISRNARCPTLLSTADGYQWLDEPTNAVGIYRNTKPSIHERPLQAGEAIIAFTDGVWHAGAPSGSKLDLPAILAAVDPLGIAPAKPVADAVLSAALALDQGRPRDDATVLVVKLLTQSVPDPVRRLHMSFPI
jgi:serine phosphatase RsbU (regulator of sigma subunit)